MPDAHFADPRLARIYDPFDPDRRDLDAYALMAADFGAQSVLDLGCGTGTFASRLARAGLEVTGVDPAQASLEVARTKPGAERVRWIHGDSTSLPPMAVDLATMTGNAAQVFLRDDEFESVLGALHDALRPGGRLVFEVRDPAAMAWRGWNRERTFSTKHIAGVGAVERWVDLVEAASDFVSFRTTFWLNATGEVLTSDSTLRFRRRDEVEAAIQGAGLNLLEIQGAPDRPGLEFVFIAERAV